MSPASGRAQSFDITVPADWSSVEFQIDPVAEDGIAAPLPRGYVRLYSGPVSQRYLAVAAPLWDLAPEAGLADITDAAARAGVAPGAFALPPVGHGKRTQPNRVLAAGLPGGATAIFAGRIAVDAPDAPVGWFLACKADIAASRGLTTRFAGVAPGDLVDLAAWICGEAGAF